MVNDLPPGPGSGVEVHIGRLVAALSSAGHTVEVFAGERLHRGAAKVLDVWDPVAARRLGARVGAFRPDVVHFHNVLHELSPSVLPAARPAAAVLTVHDHRLLGRLRGTEAIRPWAPVPVAKRLKAVFDRQMVERHVDVVVAVSAALGMALRGKGFTRVQVVDNFAEVPGEVAPIGDHIVAAGRLSLEKGIDVLLRAWSSVLGDHPGAQLRIAGTGPAEEELRRLADRVAPGRVEFMGLLDEDEMRELLTTARLVAVPSTGLEGAPLIVLEALVAGVPVAGTPLALGDLVDDEVGRVVGPGDVGALGRVLRELLDDRRLAVALGAAARRRGIERFSPDAAVRALGEVYERAIERSAAA
jgi:glycosyltransferase involved in cell wall biosynthesis